MPTNKTISQLKRLGDEANRAGLYKKAARFFHQARTLATETNDERMRIKCLFWEGYCHELSGDTDTAIPLLMEAANARSPEADPADVFNAATRLIEIFFAKKTAPFIRKLIKQTRDYLAGIHKTNWAHMLDWLEGDLEYLRGIFTKAWPLFLAAREGERRNPVYPKYTEATYLHWLCRTAFRLRDLPALRRWTETIETCEKVAEGDKIFANRARLHLFRAQRTQTSTMAPAAELALTTLDMLDLQEARNDDYFTALIDCLRTLLLAHRLPEFDRQLARFPLTENFHYFLFRSDEHLHRARLALGMAIRDDEWDTEFPPPGPDMADPEAGLSHLSQAAEFYEQARDEATQKDERLETDYYTRTLDERLARVRAIREAVHAHRSNAPEN